MEKHYENGAMPHKKRVDDFFDKLDTGDPLSRRQRLLPLFRIDPDGLRRPITVACPSGVDAGAVFRSDEMRYLDHIWCLFDTILTRLHTDRRYEDDDGVPLMAEHLVNVLGKKGKRVAVRALKNAGIISVSRGYQEGQQSKLYSITPGFRGDYRRHEITTRQLQYNLIARRNRQCIQFIERAKFQRVLMVMEHIVPMFEDLEILPCDVEALCAKHEGELKEKHDEYVRKKKREASRNRKPYTPSPFSLEDRIQRAAKQWEIVDSGEWTPKLDERGRLYTGITSLWTPLRAYLRYHGEPLVNVDIRASQPVFLCLLLLETMGEQKNLSIQLHHNNITQLNNPPNTTYSPYVGTTGPKCLQGRNLICKCDMPDDVCRFIELVCKHDVYTEIGNRAGYTGKGRSWKKRRFFGVLFSDNGYADNFYDVMKRDFPTVARVMREAKVEDYKQLSLDMQKAEAQFMFRKVIPRIMQEYEDAPMFTIHDSILTTEAFAADVKRIIQEEFWRLGVAPEVKMEHLAGIPFERPVEAV